MIEIYTDGAYSFSRNQGGWSIVVLQDDKKLLECFDGELDTTNNRMELQAVIAAIETLKELNQYECTIYSDSMYVIGTINDGWKRKSNKDLWDKFDELYNSIPHENISFKHVKGHADNEFNNRCDTLAVFASKLILE